MGGLQRVPPKALIFLGGPNLDLKEDPSFPSEKVVFHPPPYWFWVLIFLAHGSLVQVCAA